MLRRGAMPARDIIRANGDDVAGSQSERTRVLNEYTGEDWQRSKGNNGGWNYYLEGAPVQHEKVVSVPWM